MIVDKTDVAAREHYDAARKLKIDTEEHLKLAFRHLNACLELKPTYLLALLLRANISSRSRNYGAAIADLALALQVLTSGMTVDKKRVASVYGTRAGIYVKQRKYQESLQDLQKAIDIEADNGTWLYEMGKVYLAEGNQPFAQYYFQACLNDKQYKISEGIKFKALFSLGICRLNNGDTCGALTTFTKAKELNDTAPLRHYMGLSSYQAGYYKSAVEHFTKAVDMNRTCLEYHFNLAVSSFRLGDLNASLQYFTTAALHGESSQLLYFRGLVQLGLSLFIHANTDFDEAIQMDSKSKFHYAKALLLMAQSRIDEAELSCRTALSLSPNCCRCLAHQGIISHYRGDFHQAVKMLNAAVERKPDDVILTERLGLVYSDLGFYDTAVRYFDRCLALKPDSGKFYFRKAVAQISSGDVFGAHENISKALDQYEHETPMSFHVRSVALKKLGRLDEALSWATRSIMRNPKHHKFYLNRGEIYYDLHQYDECIRDVDMLLNIQSDIGQAHYLRGRALHAVGRSDEAVEDFEKSAKLIPELRRSEHFYYCSGVVYANSNRWEEACRAFTEAIQCSRAPQFVLYYHERAKVYQNMNIPAKAVEDFNVVLKHEPNNMRAVIRRCFSLKLMGKFEDAARDWKRAKKLDEHHMLQGYDVASMANISDVRFTALFEEERW